jgi:hypothetical protein
MKNQSIVLTLVSVSLTGMLVGCSKNDSGNDEKVACTSLPVTTSPQPTSCNGASFVAMDKNDYSFSSTLTLPPQTVKSMSNLTVDWSGITHDFLGHDLNPSADLNSVSLLMWQLPLSELEMDVNADSLSLIDLVVSPPPSLPTPGSTLTGTSAMLYDFKVNSYVVSEDEFNKHLDPAMYPKSMYSYMVAVATGTTLGQGFRMIQTFQPDTSSSNTKVAITNNSTKLTCEVSLRNLTITGVPGSTPALTLDYNSLTKNAHGATFDVSAITRAVVGHYTETPEELEKKFLDLDLIATDYYSADISEAGTLDFTALKDKNGASFPGVDNNGTWLVGLICGNCRNPAPWYMTILKPCTP